MPKSPPADELVWLRRIHLDVIGRPPSSKQVQEWNEGRRPWTQREIVDQLLDSERYGSHFADVWHNRIVPLEGNMRRYGTVRTGRYLRLPLAPHGASRTTNALYATLLHAAGDPRDHFNLDGRQKALDRVGPIAELLR